MTDLLPETKRKRRRTSAARLAAGGLMVGGAAASRDVLREHTGIKSLRHLATDANKHGFQARHAQHLAGWLGTRGVAAAGVPLAAVGAKNLISSRPKNVKALNIRDDVVDPVLHHSKPSLPSRQPDRLPMAVRAAQLGTVTAGGLAGSAAGHLARRHIQGKYRLAGVGVGATAGTVAGALTAEPVGRALVGHAGKGKYHYSMERGVYRKPKTSLSEVGKAATVAAPLMLPQHEQQTYVKRKRKQTHYTEASAALGLTALGLRAPSAARWAASKSPRLASLRPVSRFAQMADSGERIGNNVGMASLGVGSFGALNAARIQRQEARAQEKAAGIRKSTRLSQIAKYNNESAKALIPRPRLFAPRPVRFGGVKPGGFAQVRTPTGIKTVFRRGSVG